MVGSVLVDRSERIRLFLDSLDVTSDTWKNEAHSWIVDEINSSKSEPSRVAQFSIGEDYEDEVDEMVQQSQLSTCDAGTQCSLDSSTLKPTKVTVTEDRTLDEISQAWKQDKEVRPGDALRLLNRGIVKSRELEFRFDHEDAIAIRRSFVSPRSFCFKELPFKGYDYKYVVNSCCENVIGYMPVPVGVAGPLRIQGKNSDRTYFVPMATTEGALVASTNRGCSAIVKSGGVRSLVHEEKMTRAPVVKFPTIREAVEFKDWLGAEENFQTIKKEFDSTSRFANLIRIDVALNGNEGFVRFSAKTGDAMGMNMVSKACSAAIKKLKQEFPEMEILALSGNYCVDKKASALNWIDGRGRSVVAECVLPRNVVKSVLKTTPKEMASTALAKLQHGSDLAGCVGGSNAHAANIVAAIFIATGQDAAQVVSSAMCSTRMEETASGDLYVSCSMPCVEVGTVGGGTILRPQHECLELLSCAGASPDIAGANASALAEIVAATVLAGELSLMAALVTDQLVSSHMKLNRSRLELYPIEVPKSTPLPVPGPRVLPEREHFRVKRNSERTGCSNIL